MWCLINSLGESTGACSATPSNFGAWERAGFNLVRYVKATRDVVDDAALSEIRGALEGDATPFADIEDYARTLLAEVDRLRTDVDALVTQGDAYCKTIAEHQKRAEAAEARVRELEKMPARSVCATCGAAGLCACE